jgi:hypothetical protein
MEFFSRVIRESENNADAKNDEIFRHELELSFDCAYRAVPGKPSALAFTARVLYRDHTFIVATPIFVAYAE